MMLQLVVSIWLLAPVTASNDLLVDRSVVQNRTALFVKKQDSRVKELVPGPQSVGNAQRITGPPTLYISDYIWAHLDFSHDR